MGKLTGVSEETRLKSFTHLLLGKVTPSICMEGLESTTVCVAFWDSGVSSQVTTPHGLADKKTSLQ